MIDNTEFGSSLVDLDESELSLDSFSSFNEQDSSSDDETDDEEQLEEKEEKTVDGSDPDPNNIFGNKGSDQEKVDSEKEENKDLSGQGEDASSDEADESSPAYSSILAAMKGDGILPDIDDESIKEVRTAEDFAALVEKQNDIRVEQKLDEITKRVNDALINGVEINDVKRFEKVIHDLESITEESIEGEEEDSVGLRRQLIKQDFLNRGFSDKRAEREVEKSFNSATDIEDAKEALVNNKSFFKEEYDALLDDAKKEAAKVQAARQKMYKDFQKKVLDTEEPFIGLKIDKVTRQMVMDNLTKPAYKDEQGATLTAFQKFQKENPVEAQYYVGLMFTMTDGFKNIDKLIKPTVKTKTREHIRALEKSLNNTKIFQDSGNSIFQEAVDPESMITIDI